MCSNHHQRSRETGIALLAVLWALLLLSALATAAGFVARSSAILVHRGAQGAGAEEIADAAILSTIAALSDGRVSRHPAIDGIPKQSEWRGTKVTLTISNEAGRIDLNAATDELVLAFFQSQGLDAAHAAILVRDLRSLQYERNPISDRSTILSTTELEQIPSWRLEKLQCWMTSFTVYTGSAEVKTQMATPAVQNALAWNREHRLGEYAAAGAVSSNTLPSDGVIGDVLRIRSTVSISTDEQTAHPTSATKEWIGRLTGDIHRPMLTMRWGASDSQSSPCK
jgi:hypothetical protein